MVAEENKRPSAKIDYSRNSKLEWRRKMMVFSFFLAIAIIIWLLNALAKNYTTEINYPITYSKFPENKILVNDVPENLQLKVSAHGYALLSYKLSNRPIPINFAVSSFTMNRISGDSTRFYMLTRYAREQVARQLPGELQLLEISPDSLIFQFATEVFKKVPVTPMVSYTMSKGFTVKKEVVDPDTVMVSGPDVILDTLNFITTEVKHLGVLEKSREAKLAIRAPSGVKFNEQAVHYSIELEKFTEVQIQVPIQVTGLPDSLRLQTFPQSVRVTGQIGLSNYERIVPEAFWIEVEYSEVLENKNRLQVQIKTRPDALRSVNFYPQTVEYLLSVK